MNDNNYYKDTWTKQNSHGDLFFKNVDFYSGAYNYQEQQFRKVLKGIKDMRELNNNDKPIESVLELGAGTGRMTKIMLEVFPDIKKYYIVDIKTDHTKLLDFFRRDQKVGIGEFDITGEEFNLMLRGRLFDFVLASEVLMHIKPEDIGSVIEKCCKLLGTEGTVLNIDYTPNQEQPELKDWCFIHDYHKLYTDNGLSPIVVVDMSKEIGQKLYCYGA